MRFERLAATDPSATAHSLRQLIPRSDAVAGAVAEIIADVRRGGDQAVLELTRRLDTAGAQPPPLVVDPEILEAALTGLDDEVRAALEQAIANVRRVAEASPALGSQVDVDLGTHSVRLRATPLSRAAVYAPGGRAAYPSTVVMGVLPARVAGVEEVAVCAPPGPDGEIPSVVLGACRLAGADVVYRMGGAHAVAALAYGTESVAAVDVIVGPGNLYVQEAKRQVSAQVGIDGFAGPSDLLVLAGGGCDAAPLTMDLLAQAEHGEGTLVVAASTSPELLETMTRELAGAPGTGAVLRMIDLPSAEHGLELAQALSPEHLQLVGEEFESRAGQVTRAGCVFVGPGSGTAFGDYIAGSNHVLPTDGAARFASGLGPEHFLRRVSEVRIRAAGELARIAAPLARAEGFELHARSMEARIGDNRSDDA